MTCNHDCRNCIYSEIEILNSRCRGHNMTCNGSCKTCPNLVVINYRFKCGYKGLYRW